MQNEQKINRNEAFVSGTFYITQDISASSRVFSSISSHYMNFKLVIIRYRKK